MNWGNGRGLFLMDRRATSEHLSQQSVTGWDKKQEQAGLLLFSLSWPLDTLVNSYHTSTQGKRALFIRLFCIALHRAFNPVYPWQVVELSLGIIHAILTYVTHTSQYVKLFLSLWILVDICVKKRFLRKNEGWGLICCQAWLVVGSLHLNIVIIYIFINRLS